MEEKDLTFEEAFDLFTTTDFDSWGNTRMYALCDDGIHSLYIDAIKTLQQLESKAEFYTRIYLVSSNGFPLIGKA